MELPLEEPQVEIEVNMDAAKQYGVKPGDVRRAAATLLSGIEVGYLFEEQKVFDVVVWGVPETRHSLTNIQNLLIDAPNGAACNSRTWRTFASCRRPRSSSAKPSPATWKSAPT